MHHFFTAPEEICREQGQVRITGTDVNHIRNVLRMGAGQEILVSDGTGKDYRCRICSMDKEQVEAQILEERPGRELGAKITLYQGLPKSDKMELIIQKAVELGAARIVPVATRNAVVRLEGKKEEGKIKRWRAIAESAAKQSMRSMIPEVTSVMRFEEAVSEAEGSLGFFAYENQKGMKETEALLSQIKAGRDVSVFIGPEGGFDPEEAACARERGLSPVSLGKRILRTETAGLALLSMIMLRLEVEEERKDG